MSRLAAIAVAPVLILAGCATAAAEPVRTADNGMGCAADKAKDTLSAWAGPRGAIVRAQVLPTGRQAIYDDAGLGTVYSELKLTKVTVIAGQTPKTANGWVLGGKTANGNFQPHRGPDGSLWGPSGAAILIINPANTVEGNPDKVKVNITPVVNDQVVLSNAGCWIFSDLKTTPFSGRVNDIPGSETADAMKGAMRAYPYSTFTAVAKKALTSR